jgi:predicted nuclease of predicted toxin-antitoxin system
MRLYLDQMFRLDLAERLRSQAHDVLCASEAGQAAADDVEILQHATAEGRVLVTMDEHFGDWAVLPLDKHFGVIRVRAHPTTTENIARLLLPFLVSHDHAELRNRLVILSPRAERWIQTSES